MSAQGGPQADELRRTLQDLITDLRSLGSASKEASRETKSAAREAGNFATNYAAMQGRTAARGFAFSVAGDVSEYGTGILAGGTGGAAGLRAGAAAGIRQFSNIADPLAEASDRTIGFYAGAVRAGAQVSDEELDNTYQFFLEEAKRAKALERRVVKKSRPAEEAGYLEALDEIFGKENVNAVGETIGALFDNVRDRGRR